MKNRTTPKIPSRLSQIKTSSNTSGSMTPTHGMRRKNILDNIKTSKLQTQRVGNVGRYCAIRQKTFRFCSVIYHILWHILLIQNYNIIYNIIILVFRILRQIKYTCRFEFIL
ncbi:Hypothetical_protein [Hexamita inflata]|uniref:Hypothetical_protein n=1 Tax=Hexamita inflata TaxID=28002 RepID=A0AA86UFF3_9EUKA|nr:Hypothetical protein HINF_LOCUS41414 [Hexamita inflata]